MMKRIAVVGTGLSGLTVATKLKAHAEIILFEKSRGVGGRIATRRATPFAFDHGAQSFTVKNKDFREFLQPMLDAGVVKPWRARFAELSGSNIMNRWLWRDDYPHYVGSPSMNALAKYLANDLNILLNTQITSLDQKHNKWNLVDEAGNTHEDFDWVILTAPAPQTTTLLPKSFKYSSYLQKTQMLGCYALMLGFEQDLELDFDVALIHDCIISWISLNHTKPDRNHPYALLVDSTNAWAEMNMTLELETVKNQLIQATSEVVQQDLSCATHQAVHRWKYANSPKQNGHSSLVDASLNLGVCGDWLIHGRIEAAFISGNDLAKQLKNLL